MNNIDWKAQLGSVIRWIIPIILSPLIAANVIPQPLADSLLQSGLSEVVIVLILLGLWAWSAMQKWLTARRIAAALKLPADATPADLTAALKTKTP